MADEKTTAWFRHTKTGSVFEAAGEQLNIARKDPLCEETSDPVSAVRMELDKLGVKYPANTGYKRLSEMLADEQAKRAEAEKAAQK